jgi:putative spermidine/putrescine transport system substrate-binding protein
MKLHLLLALAASLGLLASSEADAASDITLRIGCYGGIFTEVQRKFVADLYTERTGVNVEFIDASPKTHLAKLIAAKQEPQPPYDLVYLDEDVQVEGIDAGVFDKVNPKIVTNLAQLYPGTQNPQGYGPAVVMASIGIAYDAAKLKAAGIPAPQSWADLWDPRYADHISVPSLDNIMGRVFLVAAAKVAGGSDDQLNKGLAKIAELKVQSYYISSTDLQAKFQSGDVWIAPWINGRAWGMAVRGQPIRFIMPKEGGYADYGTLDVVKGTPHEAEAQGYLNFMLEPIAQLAQAYELSYGPPNKSLSGVMAAYPKLAEAFPSSPEQLKSLNHIDWRKFARQYPGLLELWNREIASK